MTAPEAKPKAIDDWQEAVPDDYVGMAQVAVLSAAPFAAALMVPILGVRVLIGAALRPYLVAEGILLAVSGLSFHRLFTPTATSNVDVDAEIERPPGSEP